MISVPSIRIGGLTRNALVIRRVPKSAKSQQNLLGLDMFKDFAILFKFQTGKLMVLKAGRRSQEMGHFARL